MLEEVPCGVVAESQRAAVEPLWAVIDDPEWDMAGRGMALAALTYATSVAPELRDEVVSEVLKRLGQSDDERFTRLGTFLARTKLDELPQLWNVLTGEMSLVGPRPEDPAFVELNQEAFHPILAVRPGVTGLAQLAFARESDVLDAEHRTKHYLHQILPQKIGIDQVYARRRSVVMDLKILWWTAVAVLFGREVAVHRDTGRLNLRAPREPREPRSGEGLELSTSRSVGA